MKSTGGRRLAALLVLVAAVVVVAIGAFAVGAHDGSGWFGRGVMRGHAVGWGYEPGFGLVGLVGLFLVGLVIFWLIAAVLSPGGRSGGPVGPAPVGPAHGGPAPGDFDKLRELSEMHTRGELTDEEFTAAKRRILGL